MKSVTKKYTNGELTVVWKNALCVHCGNCSRGLKEVFNPQAHPWVNIHGASSEQIMAQIKKCPSGALSYYLNSEPKDSSERY